METFVNELNDKIDRVSEKYKNGLVLWWGTGNVARKLFEATFLSDLNISYVTSASVKKDSLFFGIPCMDKELIDWSCVDVVLVGAGFKAGIEIRNELNENILFSGEVICLCDTPMAARKILYYNCSNSAVMYNGEFETYDAANSMCEKGYAGDDIFRRVTSSVEKVVNGEALWERDSCLFYKKKINYPLMSVIYRTLITDGVINVLDVGGSLASSYFQNIELLDKIDKLSWTIFEQERFVKWGKDNLENERLHFINNLEMNRKDYNLIFVSASIEYMENYEEILDMLLQLNATYILFDRIPIAEKSVFCREQVSPPLYTANYALKIFTLEEIEAFLKDKYMLIEDANASVEEEFFLDRLEVVRRLLLFEKLR